MSETLIKSELAQAREIKQNGSKEEREQAQADQIIRIGNMIVERARESGVDRREVNRTWQSGGEIDELTNAGFKEVGHDTYTLHHRTDEADTQITGNFYFPKNGLDLRKRLRVRSNDPTQRYGESIEINSFGSNHLRKPEDSPLQGKLDVAPSHSGEGVKLTPDETAHAAAGILSNLRGEVAAREIHLGKSKEEANRADIDRIIKA